MNRRISEIQTTLLTSHKGVDLHAASALLVMQERLTGGEQLVNLLRCELRTFWGLPEGWDAERLVATGRYFNPNKHHFGVFSGAAEGTDWFGDDTAGRRLTSDWLGKVVATDLAESQDSASNLYQSLLGGSLPQGCQPFDVVSFSYGQSGPVLSAVLWRLAIRGTVAEARRVGLELAVARHRKQGLLINPHMSSWLAVG